MCRLALRDNLRRRSSPAETLLRLPNQESLLASLVSLQPFVRTLVNHGGHQGSLRRALLKRVWMTKLARFPWIECASVKDPATWNEYSRPALLSSCLCAIPAAYCQ